MLGVRPTYNPQSWPPGRTAFITTNGEKFRYDPGPEWVSDGAWPGTAADAGDPDALDRLVSIVPNPAVGLTELSFALEAGTDVSAWVLDASGRVVRHLLDEHLPAGEHTVTWDGRDDRGEELPAGVYFSRVRAGVVTVAGRVVLAK